MVKDVKDVKNTMETTRERTDMFQESGRLLDAVTKQVNEYIDEHTQHLQLQKNNLKKDIRKEIEYLFSYSGTKFLNEEWARNHAVAKRFYGPGTHKDLQDLWATGGVWGELSRNKQRFKRYFEEAIQKHQVLENNCSLKTIAKIGEELQELQGPSVHSNPLYMKLKTIESYLKAEAYHINKAHDKWAEISTICRDPSQQTETIEIFRKHLNIQPQEKYSDLTYLIEHQERSPKQGMREPILQETYNKAVRTLDNYLSRNVGIDGIRLKRIVNTIKQFTHESGKKIINSIEEQGQQENPTIQSLLDDIMKNREKFDKIYRKYNLRNPDLFYTSEKVKEILESLNVYRQQASYLEQFIRDQSSPMQDIQFEEEASQTLRPMQETSSHQEAQDRYSNSTLTSETLKNLNFSQSHTYEYIRGNSDDFPQSRFNSSDSSYIASSEESSSKVSSIISDSDLESLDDFGASSYSEERLLREIHAEKSIKEKGYQFHGRYKKSENKSLPKNFTEGTSTQEQNQGIQMSSSHKYPYHLEIWKSSDNNSNQLTTDELRKFLDAKEQKHLDSRCIQMLDEIIEYRYLKGKNNYISDLEKVRDYIRGERDYENGLGQVIIRWRQESATGMYTYKYAEKKKEVLYVTNSLDHLSSTLGVKKQILLDIGRDNPELWEYKYNAMNGKISRGEIGNTGFYHSTDEIHLYTFDNVDLSSKKREYEIFIWFHKSNKNFYITDNEAETCKSIGKHMNFFNCIRSDRKKRRIGQNSERNKYIEFTIKSKGK